MNQTEKSVDIFISYGHLDNREGWVTALRTRLQNRLPGLLGRDVGIWMDPMLDGTEALWSTLEEQISRSSILLSVLSPRYVTSPSCRREMEQFRRSSGESNLKIRNSYRLIRVIKTPYPEEDTPSILRDIETTGFSFYEELKDQRGFREFEATPGMERYAKFYEKSEELAQSIAGVLQKLEQRITPVSRVKVFLPSVTNDRVADRNYLERELAKVCELVRPDVVPTDGPDVAGQLAPQLSDAEISVHIFGSTFGVVPERENRSWAQIQFEAAAGKRRLAWVPENLVEIEPRQKEFLQNLTILSDPKLELLGKGFQDFVIHVLDVIKSPKRPPSSYGKAVYLVSNEDDLTRLQLRVMRKCILDRGVRVEQPVYEGDVEELRNAERQALMQTNATVIFYGLARDTWVRTRREKILQMLATLENPERHFRAIYLCSPETPFKRGVYMDLPNNQLPESPGLPPLIVLGDCAENFTCETLEPLFRTLS